MRKAIFTLAILMMAFGSTGVAQKATKLKTPGIKSVMQHYGLRGESDVPETAVWRDTSGEEFRCTYFYGEDDPYLIEALQQMNEDGEWVNQSWITFDYGFNGEIVEGFEYGWDGEDWEYSFHVEYNYSNDETEVIYQYWDGSDWINLFREVHNFMGDVTTILTYEWNGTNWNTSLLDTYTYSETSLVVLMQYMQGGAWQNEERDTYTLDFDGNVTEILVEDWYGTAWMNSKHTTYNFNGGVFIAKRVDDWTGSAWEEAYLYEYIYEDGNAKHGECKQMSGGEWYPGDGDIEMAYGYNTNSNEYEGCEVDVTYVDPLGIEEQGAASISVYPVPAHGQVTIQAEGFVRAELYNTAGQRLVESRQPVMDVATLPAGLYIIKVYDLEGRETSGKVVVR